MFNIVVTRLSFFIPLVSVVAFGALIFRMPSLWILGAYVIFRTLRAVGMGDSLGYREGIRLDTALLGGLIAVTGCYALMCRGVAWTGFLTLGVLTALFLRGFHDASERPGLFARTVIAFGWAALTYRYFVPTAGWGWWGCCMSVG